MTVKVEEDFTGKDAKKAKRERITVKDRLYHLLDDASTNYATYYKLFGGRHTQTRLWLGRIKWCEKMLAMEGEE